MALTFGSWTLEAFVSALEAEGLFGNPFPAPKGLGDAKRLENNSVDILGAKSCLHGPTPLVRS